MNTIVQFFDRIRRPQNFLKSRHPEDVRNVKLVVEVSIGLIAVCYAVILIALALNRSYAQILPTYIIPLFLGLPVVFVGCGWFLLARLTMCWLLPCVVTISSFSTIYLNIDSNPLHHYISRLYILPTVLFPFIFFRLTERKAMIAALIVPIALLFLSDILFAVVRDGYLDNLTRDFKTNGKFFFSAFYLMLATNVTINILAFYLLKGRVMREEDESQQKIRQHESEKIKAKMEVLQSQVSPHFLFNNFNILNALIDDTNSRAREYVDKLSDFLRYVINNQHHEVIALSEELQFVSNYAYLIKARFENKLQIDIRYLGNVDRIKIPPMAVQMLVENAIAHNEASTQHPLNINITITASFIEVKNKVRLKKGKSKSTGTGLKNIQQRYGYLTDEKVIITSGSEFSVKLPAIRLGEER